MIQCRIDGFQWQRIKAIAGVVWVCGISHVLDVFK
ncbi:hypothetical protein SAMN06265222_108137 [Neorhodopirellula lusitana]|uniref:Uncharacterized protein n=1 Tax=Neorhodopirellula lusitana TaxID=445327 RepID=A0ABY1Q975_9BACT|nr:hypothetical protein SAMN06265222_108137 [Neorhodopirellula lusitana]